MSQNIFALLDSEGEEDVKPKVAEPAPAAKKTQERGDKKGARDNAEKSGRSDNRDAQRGGRGGRGDRGGRGGRGPRPTREGGYREGGYREGGYREGGYRERPPRDSGVPAEGDVKESHGPRGEGERRGGYRDGERRPRGREYDRHSGTGRGREQKRGGAGKANWGNEQDAVAAAQGQEASNETPEEGAPEAVENVEEEYQAEPEDTTMTLQEYLEKKKGTQRSGEAFEKREVREVDSSAFQGAKKLQKEGKTPDFLESQFEKVFREKKSGRKKVVLEDVGFRASAPEDTRERGGRGRRDFDRREGGGRGGRGRGPARGSGGYSAPRAPAGSTPNVADTNAFPALG